MTQGYRPQICRRPPITNIPTFPSGGNLQQACVLQEELPALMTKAIIWEVEAAHGGFSTTTFYSPKSMGFPFNSGRQRPQLLSLAPEVQDAEGPQCMSGHQCRELVCHHRSEGRLL